MACATCGSALCRSCDIALHKPQKKRGHPREPMGAYALAVSGYVLETGNKRARGGAGAASLEAAKSALAPDATRFFTAAGWFTLVLARGHALGALEVRMEAHPTLSGAGAGAAAPTCRFCEGPVPPSQPSVAGLPAGLVCASPECADYAAGACEKTLPCGHACGGARGEAPCLPCFFGCDGVEMPAPSEMCLGCGEATLAQEGCFRPACGHVVHAACAKRRVADAWDSPWVDFSFLNCTNVMCKKPLVAEDAAGGSVLCGALPPLLKLQEELHRKVSLRVRAEGREKDPEILDPASQFHGNPIAWGVHRFAYYKCFNCAKLYYGGLRRCGVGAGVRPKPEELICPSCVPGAGEATCGKHGDEFIAWCVCFIPDPHSPPRPVQTFV